MAKITVSKPARQDLVSIRRCSREELCNPEAATRIINCLKAAIQGLEHFPAKGRPLDALIAVHTEYRYLVCENYCIFYLCSETDVVIVRILHQRQDSIRALLMQ